MIDYEKLKEVGAEAIHDAYLLQCKRLGWKVKKENEVPYNDLSEESKALDRASFEAALDVLEEYGILDQKRLKELTKPEPKYKVGQRVFLMGNDINPVDSFVIDEILWEEGELWCLHYHTEGNYSDGERSFDQFRESALYPSPVALIQSQIDYWKSLKEGGLKGPVCFTDNGDDIENRLANAGSVDYSKHVELEMECEHESDGMEYCPGLFEKMMASSDLTPKDLIRFNKCKHCGEFYR